MLHLLGTQQYSTIQNQNHENPIHNQPEKH